jgi:hypothetical protein
VCAFCGGDNGSRYLMRLAWPIKVDCSSTQNINGREGGGTTVLLFVNALLIFLFELHVVTRRLERDVQEIYAYFLVVSNLTIVNWENSCIMTNYLLFG